MHEDDEGDHGGHHEHPRQPQVPVQPSELPDHALRIRYDCPSVARAVIWRSGGTPVRVKRTTSPTRAPSRSLASLTLKPMVMPADMKPGISSWVSTSTWISGITARTTPLTTHVCSPPIAT